MQTRPALVFAVLNLAMGATLALSAASPFADQAVALFTLLQTGADTALADQPTTRWVMGIAGGVWAGWGAAMVAEARGAAPARAHLVGLVAWCLLDSLASLVHGAPLNVLVNLSWLALGAWTLRAAAVRVLPDAARA